MKELLLNKLQKLDGMKKVLGYKLLMLVGGMVLLGIYIQTVPKVFQEGYKVHGIISENIVQHPELLPSSNEVKLMSMGQATSFSAFLWLQSIQYIGNNAASSEYKGYLLNLLEIITDITPSFSEPYKLGLILLTEDKPKTEKEKERNNAVFELGEKGIDSTCIKEKIDAIKNTKQENNLSKNILYVSPCKDFFVPYYMAYNAFWGKSDPKIASLYYKITSAHPDGPQSSESLAAIMKGRGGDRKGATYLYLSMANTIGEKNSICTELSQQLSEVLLPVMTGEKKLSGTFLRNLEIIRKELVAQSGEKEESLYVGSPDSYCINYLNKSIREMNLLYIETADKEYRAKHDGKSALKPEVLFENKFIDYLPNDFYRDDKGKSGIYYRYDEYLKIWDIKMMHYDDVGMF